METLPGFVMVIGGIAAFLGAAVATASVCLEVGRVMMQSDVSKTEWLFPLRGRWLRRLIATVTLLIAAPVLFGVTLVAIWSLLYVVVAVAVSILRAIGGPFAR